MAVSLNYIKQNGLKDNLRCKRHQTPEGLLIHECGILSVRLGTDQILLENKTNIVNNFLSNSIRGMLRALKIFHFFVQ